MFGIPRALFWKGSKIILVDYLFGFLGFKIMVQKKKCIANHWESLGETSSFRCLKNAWIIDKIPFSGKLRRTVRVWLTRYCCKERGNRETHFKALGIMEKNLIKWWVAKIDHRVGWLKQVCFSQSQFTAVISPEFSPRTMEVENYPKWKATTIGGTHFHVRGYIRERVVSYATFLFFLSQGRLRTGSITPD